MLMTLMVEPSKPFFPGKVPPTNPGSSHQLWPRPASVPPQFVSCVGSFR